MRNLVILLSVAVLPAANATLIAPSPYLSFADSPFFGGSFQVFYLEDFEDGAFNLPNASISGGRVAFPGPFADSVDGDDGAIDGSGLAGRSWYSDNVFSTISVSFSPVNGQYPTHVGVVWTDVGNTNGPLGFGDVVFEAFAPGNTSLGTTLLPSAGDGAATGGTAEDRFLGVVDLGGVASFSLTMPTSADWEFDHVQYGIVPEPAGILLVLVATVLRRR